MTPGQWMDSAKGQSVQWATNLTTTSNKPAPTTQRSLRYTDPEAYWAARNAGKVGSVGGNLGTNAGLMSSLMQRFQSAQDEANAAGLEQYKNLMGTIDGLQQQQLAGFNQANAGLTNLGTSGMQRIAENEKNNAGKAEQDLVSRGLGNTTIRNSVLRGVSRDAEQQRQSLNENVALQKSGLLMQQAGANLDLGRLKADSILSRTNQGPDLGSYLSIIQQLARSATA